MNGKTKKIVEYFSKLPGIGPKHATRIMLDLLKWDKNEVDNFSKAISEIKDGIKLCSDCHNISDDDFCQICKDPRRNKNSICVVEKVTDLESIEKTGIHRGLYHVLGGAISPIDGSLPQNLNFASLLKRIQKYPSSQLEVIIATNPNTIGETTALYLEEQIKPFNIKITRLGRGLSAGSFLEYADEITLQNAFKNRK